MKKFAGRAEYLPQDKISEQPLFPIGEVELSQCLDDSQPIKALLLGPRGSGKTFLARKCADTLGQRTAIYGLDKETWEYRQFSGPQSSTANVLILDDIGYCIKKAKADEKTNPDAVALAVGRLIALADEAAKNNAKVLLASTENLGYLATSLISNIVLRKGFLSTFIECCYYDDVPQLLAAGLRPHTMSNVILRDFGTNALSFSKSNRAPAVALEYAVRQAFNMKDLPFLWSPFLWSNYKISVKELSALPGISEIKPWLVNSAQIEKVFGEALKSEIGPLDFGDFAKKNLPDLEGIDNDVLYNMCHRIELFAGTYNTNLRRMMREWHGLQSVQLDEYVWPGSMPLASLRELAVAHEKDGEVSSDSLNKHLIGIRGHKRIHPETKHLANTTHIEYTWKDLNAARNALRHIWGEHATASYSQLARALLAAGDDDSKLNDLFLQEGLRQER